MRFELIISSLQDWCLTIMALEAYLFLIKHLIKNTVTGNRTLVSFLTESILPLNYSCWRGWRWEPYNFIMLSLFHYEKVVFTETILRNKIFNKPIIKTKGLKLFKEEHTLFIGAHNSLTQTILN